MVFDYSIILFDRYKFQVFASQVFIGFAFNFYIIFALQKVIEEDSFWFIPFIPWWKWITEYIDSYLWWLWVLSIQLWDVSVSIKRSLQGPLSASNKSKWEWFDGCIYVYDYDYVIERDLWFVRFSVSQKSKEIHLYPSTISLWFIEREQEEESNEEYWISYWEWRSIFVFVSFMKDRIIWDLILFAHP